MKEKIYKCRWSHCRHESKDVPESEAVKSGNSYYHADCYKEKKAIEEALTVWSEKIDQNVVFTTLRRIINNLIFKRGYDAEYVLYCVKIGAKEGWLHYPQGLYQTCGDKKRQGEWKRIEAKKYLETLEPIKEEQSDQPVVKYTYAPPKEKTIANIFG